MEKCWESILCSNNRYLQYFINSQILRILDFKAIIIYFTIWNSQYSDDKLWKYNWLDFTCITCVAVNKYSISYRSADKWAIIMGWINQLFWLFAWNCVIWFFYIIHGMQKNNVILSIAIYRILAVNLFW